MTNNYSSLSTSDLEEIYSVTKANYGAIDGQLLEEINRRGGEAAFLAEVEKDRKLKKEKARIASEVALLMKGQTDPHFAKTMITSNLLSEQELSTLIDSVARRQAAHQFNTKIDTSTLLGAALGVLIGSVLGAIITFFQVYLLGSFFYISLVIVYLVSWLTLRLITRKDAGNVIVLIAAVLATIAGPVVALGFLLK